MLIRSDDRSPETEKNQIYLSELIKPTDQPGHDPIHNNKKEKRKIQFWRKRSDEFMLQARCYFQSYY